MLHGEKAFQISFGLINLSEKLYPLQVLTQFLIFQEAFPVLRGDSYLLYELIFIKGYGW